MKIYLAHASSFDVQDELYLPIKNSALMQEHQFIFPHENPQQLNHSKEIIKTCHLMIAEVSYPSTGLGVELGWAESFAIPIVAIHKANCLYSTSIQLITDKIISYEDNQQLIKKLKEIVSSII